MRMDETLFETKDFSVELHENQRMMPVLSPVSIRVKKGGCTGIIGESGCGKSVFCRAALGLLEAPKWQVRGAAFLEGERLPVQEDEMMDRFRGERMTMIVQNPLSAFDPRMTIKAHFLEGCPRRNRAGRYEEAIRQLSRMYIQDPERVLGSYPFQLSGGMLQRVLIALCLQSNPGFLVADEPTTALDSTVQAEILKLLVELRKERGISILLVSHDLEVISKMADSVYVMYAGQVVEQGTMDQVRKNPLHPYTQGLFRARPSFSKERLFTMPGRAPGLLELGKKGCPFAERCPVSGERCGKDLPKLRKAGMEQRVRCWHQEEKL